MKDDPLPDSDNVTRLCGLAQLNEAGHPTATAFMPRPGESFLSVNWLEYLQLPNRSEEIIEVLRVLGTKRKVPAQAKLALLNVGREEVQSFHSENCKSNRYRPVDVGPQQDK